MNFKDFLNEANKADESSEYIDSISTVNVEYLSDEDDDGQVEISIKAEFYSDSFDKSNPKSEKEWKSAAKKLGIYIPRGESVDVKDDLVKFGKFKMHVEDVESLIDKLEDHVSVDVVEF